MSYLEVLESELRDFQIDLPSEQKSTLARYCDELRRWNKRINLTGLSGRAAVRRLVVEPAWIGLQLKPRGVLTDIGSGNGSPALPLHIVSGLRRTHLVEVRAKRAAFLRHSTTTLKLADVIVHRASFEDVASDLRPVDWVTLQGLGLNLQLIDSIKKIASPTTTVVWITSPDVAAPLKPTKTLQVPITGTKVFLFHLDLS